MLLANGIVVYDIKNIPKYVEGVIVNKKEFEVCYWKGCKNINDNINKIIKKYIKEASKPMGKNITYELNVDMIKDIRKMLKKYNKKKWDSEVDKSMWEWEDIEYVFKQYIKNLKWAEKCCKKGIAVKYYVTTEV